MAYWNVRTASVEWNWKRAVEIEYYKSMTCKYIRNKMLQFYKRTVRRIKKLFHLNRLVKDKDLVTDISMQ